jgi:Fic family protein
MKIKRCVPPHLPLRAIRWESFAALLGKAHASLARYDEILKNAKDRKVVLPILLAQESISSIESKKTFTSLKRVVQHPGSGKRAGDADRLMKILHYRTALLQGARKIKSHPFSGALILEMHGMIRKDAPVLKKDIGRWRDRQNWIGPEGCRKEEAYFFPPNLKVMHERIGNWLHYLNSSDLDPIIQMAIAFAQFLAIHPFMDANGRVIRALIPIFFYKKKVSSYPIVFLSSYFKRNRLKYFEKLYAVNSKNQWEEWIRFFLQAIIKECEANKKKVQQLLVKRRAAR